MTRKTITKLNQNPSKQEEIDFLREVAECVSDTSYLRSLFTPEFLNLTEQYIRNDFAPSILENWKQDLDMLNSNISNLRIYKERSVRQREADKIEINALLTVVDELKAKASNWKAKCAGLANIIDDKDAKIAAIVELIENH